jgi:L-fuconolactonase
MRIDSHHHFWHFSAQEQPWMREEMSALKRSFLPEDLLPLLKTIGFQGSVAIQARQMLKETEWLLELAEQHDFICAVVGWVDLRAPDVEAQLSQFAGHSKLKGVRHVIHDEPDDDFMLRKDFQNGISKLKSFELTYDLLIFAITYPMQSGWLSVFQSSLSLSIISPSCPLRRV